MKRGLCWIAILGIGVFVVGSCAYWGDYDIPVEKRTEGMEYMVIDKDVYLKDRAGPVFFTHDKHFDDYGIACNECHHVYEDGKNVWTDDDSVDTCESCHDPVEGSDGVYRLETAFHKNCRTCHKAQNEQGEVAAAPMLCQGCHVVEHKRLH